MDPGRVERLEGNRRREVSADVVMARQTLDDARCKLDLAVAALPDVDGDRVMATPALLSLLVGAVRAKEHLGKLEAQLKEDLPE